MTGTETVAVKLKRETGEVLDWNVEIPKTPSRTFVTLGAALVRHPDLADLPLYDGDTLLIDVGENVMVEADSTFYVYTALWLKEEEGVKRLRLKARNLGDAIREVWRSDFPEPSLHIYNEEDEVVAESVCVGIRG